MKTGRDWWALTGIVVLMLLGLYVGAYLALVDAIPGPHGFDVPATEVIAAYRSNPAWRLRPVAESVFWPINQIDRKVRPAIWGVSPPIYVPE